MGGPVCRLCRREGTKLFLKGEKCFTGCVLEKRPAPPGLQGGKKSRVKFTEYAKRLREKQKARRTLGLGERPFRRIFAEAARRPGRTGETLLKLLELRLDNLVRRLGFATSIAFARQLVRHGHIQVNGKRETAPGRVLKAGDKISLAERLRQNPGVLRAREVSARTPLPSWLKLEKDSWEGELLRPPAREETSLAHLNEQLIVELYSR